MAASCATLPNYVKLKLLCCTSFSTAHYRHGKLFYFLNLINTTPPVSFHFLLNMYEKEAGADWAGEISRLKELLLLELL